MKMLFCLLVLGSPGIASALGIEIHTKAQTERLGSDTVGWLSVRDGDQLNLQIIRLTAGEVAIELSKKKETIQIPVKAQDFNTAAELTRPADDVFPYSLHFRIDQVNRPCASSRAWVLSSFANQVVSN